MLGSSISVERVTARVDDVLEKLEIHYEKHKREYAHAYQDYRIAALESIQERARFLDGAHEVPVGIVAIDLRFEIEPPDDHRLEYERAIGMLTLHKNAGQKTIKITPELYAAYCQDQWTWKEAFYNKNISYSRR